MLLSLEGLQRSFDAQPAPGSFLMKYFPPACDTKVLLQPKPSFCLVNETVLHLHALAAHHGSSSSALHLCSSGNGSSWSEHAVGRWRGYFAVPCHSPAALLPTSGAITQDCKAVMSTAGMLGSLLALVQDFLTDSWLMPEPCFLFLVPYDCKLLFHSLPALLPRWGPFIIFNCMHNSSLSLSPAAPPAQTNYMTVCW